MTSGTVRVVLFSKDLTGSGSDRCFWLNRESLEEIGFEDIVEYSGPIVCHDFWLIRDSIRDAVGRLPKAVIDLDEFRISTSGMPADRTAREKSDVTKVLAEFGLDDATSATYRKALFCPSEYNVSVGLSAANAMLSLFHSLVDKAERNGELKRFFEIEVPVYHELQNAMSAGVGIDTRHLSEMRKEAEFEFYSYLKHYSAKHDMPLEVPSSEALKRRLLRDGFDLDGVSMEYILEYLPHPADFGTDTLELVRLGAARIVLSSLALSVDRVRPIIDIFGSRTSRIQLRSPSLQNIPKRCRSMIVARNGGGLSYVDFDQYEVGIMAALSGDPELLELYGAGDMYSMFAERHLGMADSRKAAKQLFLSYAYGMSRSSLVDAAVSLGASRARAKAAFKVFKQYEEWKRSVESEFGRTGRIGTAEGNYFARDTFGELTSKERRSAVSQVVQGTASLIFKKALLAAVAVKGVEIVLPMHDALLFEHHDQSTPGEVVKVFESVMTAHFAGAIKGKASLSQF